ncbi:glycosyltransferase family 4 protein [Thiosocius teredinicola]|uniref:glycosyltransferase family 4 protein n=1 Tax=Thiosocius teredinicola TaxID=1973002 RepID=UPI00099131BF
MGEKPRLGRILCVTSNLPRWEGDSTTPFVLNLAEDMQALGWEIDLLAPHADGAALNEELAGVNVERFRYFWPSRGQTVCYHGGALVNLRKNKSNHLKLPALLAAEWFAVSRRLKTRSYNLLHSHWILPQGFIGMLAGRPHSIPHVITVHGGDIFGLKGRLMRQAKRLALRSADAITVNSRSTGNAVKRIAHDLEQLHCIPMGVNTRAPDPEIPELALQIRARHRGTDGPLLLFLGRIVDEKGLEDLLHAMAIVRQDQPGTRLLVVGEGQDRAELESLTHSLGLADHVDFVGWQDHKTIAAYFAAADIYVAPSRRAVDGWIEAQGLTVLESMVAGTPVIATRLGGFKDSVIHDRSGLLVDQRAPQQIADAVRRIATTPGLSERLTANASLHASEKFSRLRSANDFSALFSRMITSRQA